MKTIFQVMFILSMMVAAGCAFAADAKPAPGQGTNPDCNTISDGSKTGAAPATTGATTTTTPSTGTAPTK